MVRVVVADKDMVERDVFRVVMADKDRVEAMLSVSSWRTRPGWKRCCPCRHGGQGQGGARCVPRRHGGQGQGGGDVVRVVMADKDRVGRDVFRVVMADNDRVGRLFHTLQTFHQKIRTYKIGTTPAQREVRACVCCRLMDTLHVTCLCMCMIQTMTF